ncbi:hypothetical protein [Streptomyces sp. NPDC002588]|uniref:hypothetical protein n=1 Tax=Streptomyces sp. NPDC002588 TaxID=3154419 RepID=UPI0033227861
MLRHAGAGAEVTISLRFDEYVVVIGVVDDGAGKLAGPGPLRTWAPAGTAWWACGSVWRCPAVGSPPGRAWVRVGRSTRSCR